MKTKISLLIGAVAIVTLSFTFVNNSSPTKELVEQTNTSNSAPVGGFVSDEIVK